MSARERRIVWIGQRGEDAEFLYSTGSLAAIICCDWSPHLAELAAAALPVESLERASGTREAWSSASLARFEASVLAGVLERAGEVSGSPLTVLPYRALPAIEAALELWSGSVRLAAPAATHVDALDNKITQRRLLATWGIATPEWTVLRPRGIAASLASHGILVRFPAVVQRPRGSLGRQTLRTDTPAELMRLPESWVAEGELLLSSYHEGPVINVTGVVSGTEIHLAWPSIQLVGLEACGGEGAFLYCGNDFAATSLLPHKVIEEVLELSRSIAMGLGSLSFRGLFGLDVLWNGRQVLALEINPRFQGSTALLTALELQAGVEPTVAKHLKAFQTGELSGERSSAAQAPRRPLKGAEIVLYHQRSGRADTPGPNWALVAARRGFPVPGTLIEPGASLGRLRFKEGVLRPELDRLRPEIEDALGTFPGAVS